MASRTQSRGSWVFFVFVFLNLCFFIVLKWKSDEQRDLCVSAQFRHFYGFNNGVSSS